MKIEKMDQHKLLLIFFGQSSNFYLTKLPSKVCLIKRYEKVILKNAAKILPNMYGSFLSYYVKRLIKMSSTCSILVNQN